MTQDRRTHLIAWTSAGLLHVAVAAMLLIQATAAGPPAGPRPQASASIMHVSLIPTAATTAPPAAGTAPPTSALERAAGMDPNPAPTGPQADHGAAVPPAPGASADTAAGAATVTPEMTQAALLSYRQLLQAHLARYQRYPLDARRSHVEGTVLLHFVLGRDGRISDAWIVQSSGSAALDAEALLAIQRAEPLPSIPSGWPASLDIVLPIAFALS
jgi:protein TonB